MANYVNNENYVTIQGWMINELNLKGNELLIYAIIYGFSQACDQSFSGTLSYLADWTNSTKQGVIKCLKSLTEKGYIIKKEDYINGVKFCEYRTTNLNEVLNKVEQGIKQSSTDPLNKVEQGIKQSLTNPVNKVESGIKQSLPNNIIYNINNNIEDNKESEKNQKSKRFVPPTVEEVRLFCIEKGYHIDAESFVDFYTAKGWKVGKNPMVDWKAAVRTWVRRSANNSTSSGNTCGNNNPPEFEEAWNLLT